jgi:membrane fusion protein (multidrug efflux system)
MKKVTHSIIGFSLLLSVLSCQDEKADQSGTETKTLTVETYAAIAQPFNSQLITTANLMAEEQVDVMAPITGQVLNIYFKEGQKITKGQTIVRLDDRSWKAELLGVNAEFATSEKEYNRKKELLDIGGSSQEEIDMAYAKMQSLQSKQQQLQVNINLANVVAPFTGQLGMRNFSEGAFLQQGALITSLTANAQLKVDFSVAQVYKKSIEVNKKVIVLVDNDSLEATIYAVSPSVNQETRMISARAMLDAGKNQTILPGTYAEVILPINAINDALLVPTQAVVPSITEQTVYVYNNGKAERRVVTLGNRTADKVHVLTGIKSGDIILTTGLLAVKDGMSISIKQPK